MAYIALWLWAMGAYMMWEDTYDRGPTKFDPDYSLTDKVIHSGTQLLIVLFWPVTVTCLMIYQATVRPRG